MNNKNKLILAWLQDNVPDFVKYYPNTKRVKLKNGNHSTFRKLFKEITGTPKATSKSLPEGTAEVPDEVPAEVPAEVPKKKRKYTRKLKNTDK